MLVVLIRSLPGSVVRRYINTYRYSVSGRTPI